MQSPDIATQKKNRASGWTDERRSKHAEAMRQWKPWEKSTGPKTQTGKTRAAYNAYKHGCRSAAHVKLDKVMRAQSRFIQQIEELVAFQKNSRKRTIEARRKRALTLSAKRAARTTSPVILSASERSQKILQSLSLHQDDNYKLPRHCGEHSDAAIHTEILQFSSPRRIENPMWTVAAMYRFVSLTDLPKLQAEIKAAFAENGICGTLLIAPEGINGTIAGIGEKLDAVIDLLDRLVGVKSGELKYSTSTGKPFLRMKVRQKREIITMAAPEANPTELVGTYVTPQDWNDLISDPDVTVLDTRNDYETAVGIFKGAIDPDIQKFTDFKDFVAEKLDPAKNKKIAMFCTGGIRCEKASSYMLAHGFEEVYHLQGGILKYLETIPAEKSLWEGECFVFDRRVAVGHGLEEGNHDICYGCRFPLKPGDKEMATYEIGVSCPRCHGELTEHRAESLRTRHAQFQKDGFVQV